MLDEDNPYKCENCGSTKVQRKEWVEINSGKSMGEVSDGENRDNWCPDCETHCEIIDNE